MPSSSRRFGRRIGEPIFFGYGMKMVCPESRPPGQEERERMYILVKKFLKIATPQQATGHYAIFRDGISNSALGNAASCGV